MAVEEDFKNGHVTMPVFDFIEFDKYIIDELHALLRIFDKLLTLLIQELTDHPFDKFLSKQKTSMQKRLQDAMNALEIKFKYYINKNGDISWSCLYKRDRVKALKELDFTRIFCEDLQRADLYTKLWRGFHNVYCTFSSEFENTKETRLRVSKKLRVDMTEWLKLYMLPAVGTPGTPDYVPGMFSADDVTPYMHSVLAEMLFFIGTYGSLKLFSCFSLEAKNGMQTTDFFRTTSKGGWGRKPSHDIIERELLLYVFDTDQ